MDDEEYGEFVLPPPINLEVMDEMIQKTVEDLWSKFDKNQNGYLDKEEALEFIRQTLDDVAKDVAKDDEAIEEAFNQFDVDGNGRIAKPEMIHFIRSVINGN